MKKQCWMKLFQEAIEVIWIFYKIKIYLEKFRNIISKQTPNLISIVYLTTFGKVTSSFQTFLVATVNNVMEFNYML